MKCAVHPDVDAIGYCRNCGKALCSVCARPIRDVFYCEDCLAGAVGIPPTPYTTGPAPYVAGAAPYVPPPGQQPGAIPPRAHTASSPAIAFILGFCPGLGAIYNGEYNKALIHIVVFAAMIVGLSSGLGGGADTALGLLLAGFVFYMAFDSMRTAKAKQLGEVTVDPLESWSKERPIGPIILIGVGVLFLLNNFEWFPFYRIERFWPLILIGVGVLMFRNRLGRPS
jgi:cell wall-active antibiotic response 4TMS protein YvqF